MFSVGLKQ